MKYRKITADGKITETDSMSLEEMQEFVGGYIEYVGNIICNEDGLRLNLPANKLLPAFVGNVIIETTEKEAKFNTLTEAYNLLAEANTRMQALAQRLEAEFKPPDYQYDDWYGSPFSKYELSTEHLLELARDAFTGFTVSQIEEEYKNLTIDRSVISKFVEDSKRFDAQEVINYVRQVYADVDGISYTQILKKCKSLLPWKDGSVASKPEHIPWINENGIELRIYGQGYEQKERVSVFLKLVDIVLRGTKPSQAEGRTVGQGEVYRDDRIKSLRYFKNGTLKVLFHNVEDAEKMKAALVSEGVTA